MNESYAERGCAWGDQESTIAGGVYSRLLPSCLLYW